MYIGLMVVYHSLPTLIYIVPLSRGEALWSPWSSSPSCSSHPPRPRRNRAIDTFSETRGSENQWLGLAYPLVNCHITMENHFFFNGKIHYTWPFSIAICIYMLVYQRVRPPHFLKPMDSHCVPHFWCIFLIGKVKHHLKQTQDDMELVGARHIQYLIYIYTYILEW